MTAARVISPPRASLPFTLNCSCTSRFTNIVLVVQRQFGGASTSEQPLADRSNGAMMEIQQLAKSSDESLVALGIILDAWDEGADAGVDCRKART